MDDLHWDDVRVFDAARAQGSFSRAATALGVQQSTVSRRIAALEDALGGAVFLRTPGGLVLTDRGHAVADAAARMADAAKAVALAGERVDDGASGTVRVALAEGFAAWGLVPRLEALFREHPGLSIELVVSAAAADLSRRDADLALRFMQPQGADLVARRLMWFDMGVLVHERHAETPWEDLPWVIYGDPLVTTTIDAWYAAQGIAPVLRTNGYSACVAAVQAGLGASLLTTALARELPGVVVRPCPVDLPPPLPLWLVAHRAVRPLRRVDVVWRALEAMIEALGPEA